MFRISHYLQELASPTPLTPARTPPGPVVIWNLTRRCNLTCKHCYAIAADKAFSGELTPLEALGVVNNLVASRVPALILSGGEPLLRPDLFILARHAKSTGIYVALSTNGTLINEERADRIAAVGFDYVGISLDGLAPTHDQFRRKSGAFAQSLTALRLCRDRGLKVGVRFTLTQDNFADLPALLELIEEENIDRFYLSHLNYAGRGNKNRRDDAHHQLTRQAMDRLFATAWHYQQQGRPKEFTTGNNDADGVYLLHWVRARFPERAAALQAKLEQWGGNASGINVANIDNLGQVHPDTMWWHHSLGQIRNNRFADLWNNPADPLLMGLKRKPRPVTGRCGRCQYLAICGGNTRVRAQQLTGDPWAEDPGCYLTDEEMGDSGKSDERSTVG